MSDEQNKSKKNSGEAKVLADEAGVYIPSDGESEAEPKLDFGSFIISLGTSAYVSMGKVNHPDLKDEPVDLPAAKNVIEILDLLLEKTKGNLEPEEDRLLVGLIHELKLAYVEST